MTGHGDTTRRSAPVEVYHHRVRPRRKHVPDSDPPPGRSGRGTDWLSLDTGHISWLNAASALSEDSAPSASLDHLKAWAAPTHPGAPPEQVGGLPWPQQPASGRPKDADAPLSTTSHVLEWAEVACGGRHCAAMSKTGHVFTWGSDDAGQCGHGKHVTQRLPCLLWLRRAAGKKYELVDDVRTLGCGHRYTAALTWRGELFLWGQLGAAGGSKRRPPCLTVRWPQQHASGRPDAEDGHTFTLSPHPAYHRLNLRSCRLCNLCLCCCPCPVGFLKLPC